MIKSQKIGQHHMKTFVILTNLWDMATLNG